MSEVNDSSNEKKKIDEMTQKNEQLTREVQSLKRQLEWFQRQLFGRKSERREFESPLQQKLEGLFPEEETPTTPDLPQTTVASYQRKKRNLTGCPDDSGLRFNDDVVPIKEIHLTAPELSGANASDYEVIRYDHTYRLAQHPSSYEVLKYIRPVVKHKTSQMLITQPAPSSVFGKSIADVSFATGLLIEKFLYHQPLYRQHQRLEATQILISRSTLTNLVEKAAALLTPVAHAVRDSIIQGQQIAMDETPIKAGHAKKPGAKRGAMKQGYIWPMMGDKNEVYFHYDGSRSTDVVRTLLKGFEGTLLSDGYTAYTNYTKSLNTVEHALCWAHSRRYFEKALEDEPELAHYGLDHISALYAHEEKIKEKKCTEKEKLAYRGEHSKKVVDAFFLWCKSLEHQPDLIATESPILTAVKYALKREAGLRLFLEDPNLPLDTNHVERMLRVIPCGRKNWMFCWTELGAKHVGIIQTLICSCKLQGVDPYTYFNDVLQRVDRHPASQVHKLTPRLWKETFADNPLTSDLLK